MVVRLPNIDKSQRHKNKCLQGNHKNMEDCPCQARNNMEHEQHRVNQTHAAR